MREAEDPTYYQETFYFTILIVMSKERGGSRDETKNDIRAIAEILTVTLVEPEKGGVQRDLGSKYLSTLKLHARRPKNVNKAALMKKLVLHINNLRGISVLRYKERKPKPRRKQFRGTYKITERDYWQSPEHESDVMDDAAELTTGGPQKTGGAPFNRAPKKKPWKSAPPGAPGGLEEDRLDEDVLIKIGAAEKNDLMSFGVRRGLKQQVWDGERAPRGAVKAALMDIVDEFLGELDMEMPIKDVVITGSLANYNWSQYSDIDVHIIVDFAAINPNEKLVKRFFDAVRSRWNKLHDIRVKGHEVEIYVQNDDEPHVSTGVYSLTTDRWVVKPKKVQPEIDLPTARKKVDTVVRELDRLAAFYDHGRYTQSFESAAALKDKISTMRKSGLEKTGIYSPENLAFKMLRRSGDIEKLFDIYTKSYDKVLSLDQ